MDNIAIILVLVAAAAAGNFIFLAAWKRGAARKAALEALAQEKGWTTNYRKPTGGRGSRRTFADPDGRWTLTLYTGPSNTTSGTSTRSQWTEFEAPSVALPAGLAVLGPPMPAKTAQMAGAFMDGLMGKLVTRLMMGLGSELAAEIPRLNHVENVSPEDGTLFATQEAMHALDPVLGHSAFGAARQGRNEMMQPIVMRGTFGLRVRIRRNLHKPEEIEALIAFGLVLTEAIEAAEGGG